MDTFTIEQFKNALPANYQKSVNPELVAQINSTLSDPDMYEVYRENLLGFTEVMSKGKFTVPQYISAIKYVSHKVRGKTNLEAFTITFPEKIQDWQARNLESKDIASHITAYNKSKLVNLIYEQTMIPTHILNQDIHQKAVNHLATLMLTAKSEKVQGDAAATLLRELKAPETTKIELDIGTKENSAIDALRESTEKLVAAQRAALESQTVTATELAHAPLIIESTAEEVVQ